MKMETEICVLSLNCWGIKGVSLDRVNRMTAIADSLSSGIYDFVFLQEVWTTEDYDKIKSKTQDVLPYSHYFYSGVIGAGICIFSKAPIKSAFFHQWAVNGYVHKIYHGDWFGGKGIGLAQVVYRGLNINLYTTHLHAEYDRVNDEYVAHRITQAFDTAQFISLTSQAADLVIVGGDLNTEPGDLAYRVIVHCTQLRDAFFEVDKPVGEPEKLGYTNDTPNNSYTSTKSLSSNPFGKRIDYITYKPGKCVKVHTLTCDTPWPTRVPGQTYSYSDHEAVVVRLKINKSSAEEGPVHVRQQRKQALEESVEICSQALKNLRTTKSIYFGSIVMSFLVLLAISSFELTGWLIYFKLGAQFVLSILLAFSIFQGVIFNRMEVHGILAGKLGMELELANHCKFEPEEVIGDVWTEIHQGDCKIAN